MTIHSAFPSVSQKRQYFICLHERSFFPEWVQAKERVLAQNAGYQMLSLPADSLLEASFQRPSALQDFLQQNLPESAFSHCLLSGSGKGIFLIQMLHEKQILRPDAEAIFWGSDLPVRTPNCTLPVYAAHAAAPNLCFCLSGSDGIPNFYAWQNYQLMMEREIPAKLICFPPVKFSRESAALWNRYLAEVFLWMQKYTPGR